VASCEVLENEEVREEMFQVGAHQDIAKDRKYLIGIEHPSLFLQAVSLVEALDLGSNPFRTGNNGFHLAYRRLALVEFFQTVHAALEWLLVLNE
jgi:hypothetical protein